MSPAAIELTGVLRRQRLRVFRTTDVVGQTGETPSAVVHALARMQRAGIVCRLRRGVWANRMVDSLDPCEAVTQISAPWPSYVSLQTALSRAGVIHEVPPVIHAVTAGRPMVVKNDLGEYHFHHLPSRLFWGYSRAGAFAGYPQADPEKAFLDIAYLGLVPRSRVGLPYSRTGRWPLDGRKLFRYARRFKSKPLSRYIALHFSNEKVFSKV